MSRPVTLNSTRIADWLAATVFVLVPFHAFLTVTASRLFGHYTLLRLWDDFLLVVLAGIVIGWLALAQNVRQQLFSSFLFRLIALYIVLTLALAAVALVKHEVTPKACGFALIVNLRFLVWFVVVWLIAARSDWLRQHWKTLVLWPALLVSVFAALQFFVLPHNFLAHFGYNKNTTIAPALTINQNTNTIRAQSFLRGPNQLGAYLALIVGLVCAFARFTKQQWRLGSLLMLAGIALFLSFSRSAWIGVALSVLLAIWLRLKTRRLKQLVLAGAFIGMVLLTSAILLFGKSQGVRDVILHEHVGSYVKETSNQGHVRAFQSGIRDIVHQPLGAGPGTAGPASFYNTGHGERNSESYFLEIGQETGWIGLILFTAITVLVGWQLWLRRQDVLALGLFVTLVGLTVVNQFGYGWSDDTLAFIWWGLAGVALAGSVRGNRAKAIH